MNKQIVFGVDAGGSKTKVLVGEVVDGKLRHIGSSAGSTGNPRSVGFDMALSTIQATIRGAYASAGIEPAAADYACFSVAGAGRSEERQRIFEWCMRQNLAMDAVVVGDAECLLAAARGGGESGSEHPVDKNPRIPSADARHLDSDNGIQFELSGIALIAGTGSMAWGRNASGSSSRAGGWGFLFDDEGSGYWLATQVLRHSCHAADARKGSTHLLQAVLEHLRLSNAQELIGWCYEASDPRTQIASLAPVVFQEYSRDPIAREIAHSGAQTLAKLVAAVAGELAFSASGFTLACAGSVLLRQPLYRSLLKTELDRLHATPGVIRYVEDPVEGALNIAWSRLANHRNR